MKYSEHIRILAKRFVASLGLRYTQWVSDPFLTALLVQATIREVEQSLGDPPISNLAYAAAVRILESILERELGAPIHGHHSAQAYCQLFGNENLSVWLERVERQPVI